MNPNDALVRKRQQELVAGEDVPVEILEKDDSSTFPHSHPFWEIRMLCRNRLGKVERILIIPPGVKHSVWDLRDYKRIIHYQIWNKGVRVPVEWNSMRSISVSQPLLEHILRLLEMLRELRKKIGEQAQPLLNAHTRAFGRMLLALFEEGLKISPSAVKGNTFIQAARYILVNISRSSLTIAEVAAYVGIRENGLSRVFRRSVGMSARHFLMVARARATCDRLATSTRSLGILAEECGWSSREYMAISFRRLAGMTLDTYRKRCQTGRREYPEAMKLPETEETREIW